MSAWILLRGLTREARHWGGFSQCLAAATLAGDHPVTLIDLPGNGSETGQRAPLEVRAMTGFVRERAAALGLRAPYRVLAMSLGGMVATDWAQRHDGEIERLVLVNTSMRPFCATHERLRPSAWPALMRIAMAWNDAQASERLVHGLTCNRVDAMAEDLAAWTQIRHGAKVGAANAFRQLWAAARFSAHREPPRCATLLLSSKADRLVDPACSRHIAAHWGAAHAEHAWAGHDLPHDDPQWTAETIAHWLRTLA